MDKNDIQVHFLNKAVRIENKTGYALARNGLKLRVFAPFQHAKEVQKAKQAERELNAAMRNTYGIWM